MPDGNSSPDMSHEFNNFDSQTRHSMPRPLGLDKDARRFNPTHYERNDGPGIPKKSEKPERPELKQISKMSFLEVQKGRRDEKTDIETRNALNNRLDQLVKEADNAGHFDRARSVFVNIIKTNNWDEILPAAYDAAHQLEEASHRNDEYREEWTGMIQTTIEGNANAIILRGIVKGGKGNDRSWLEKHGYDAKRIDRMQRDASLKNIYDLLPSKAEELVGQEKKRQKESSMPDNYVTHDEIRLLIEQQGQILEDFHNQKLTLDQFLNISQKQTAEARERYARVGPLEERRRWADAAFDIDFYQRFSPNVEPNFYTSFDPERRKRFDSLWQVARCAYIKKALASFPEKYKENTDLQQFGKEHEEIVWGTPSFKDVLRGQARSVKYSEKINVPGYGNICIWDCSDMKMFNAWRLTSAKTEITRTPETRRMFAEYVQKEAQELYGIDPTDREGMAKVAEILLIEDTAAAFGILSMFGYVESNNTRYGGVEFTAGLPGAVESADFRGVFHPQERYEGKMNNKQNWGQFSLWGIRQMQRIDAETGKKQNTKTEGNDYYEYHFVGADKNDYWTWTELSTPAVNVEKASKAISKGGRAKVIEVRIPECHPITTCKSYLENPKIEQKMLNGENPNWSEIGEDDVVVWLFSKFNKSVQLVEYFNPGKPIEPEKSPMWGLAWAQPLEEILDTRLEMEKVINTVQTTAKTYQTYDKLKAWLVYAATGGIDNPDDKQPTFNRTLDQHIIGGHLSSRRARALFLKNWKQLTIIRQGLF